LNRSRAGAPPSTLGNLAPVGLTPYHISYFAHELTKQSASGSMDRLAEALADAQVDLNPHQVDAALFALRNPLSRGVILADEVGLGKTIEAGLLLSQRWAERKRKLLVIVPANLRMQWSQEMADKFHLPSIILESTSFNQSIASGNLNPFEQSALVICSCHFARSKNVYVHQTKWDLVVVDEAHRLRNVYKPSSRIAQTIKAAIEPSRDKNVLRRQIAESKIDKFEVLRGVAKRPRRLRAYSRNRPCMRTRTTPRPPHCWRALRRYRSMSWSICSAACSGHNSLRRWFSWSATKR
jgi:hypothetical protein